MANTLTVQIRLLLRLVATLTVLSFASQANAAECLSYLYENTEKDGEPKLCQSSYTGISQQYSCQDYRADELRFRVLYRGGLVPKAIVELDANEQENLVWSTSFGDKKMTCSLPPPTGIPVKARHRGTGICYDEANLKVPCSVYEHAPARQTDYHRYLVFYEPNGQGPSIIDAQVAGANENAMVAELAYQIGLSLLETSCCSENAMAYLEYAHRLFPHAKDYHLAYKSAKSILAAQSQKEDFEL